MAKDIDTQTAVLYRDNESMLPLVDLLEREGVSYRIKNGDLAFFTNRIVMDIRNIICFSADPSDGELFMKIYYKIKTYLKKNEAEKACRYANSQGMDVIDAALLCLDLNVGKKKTLKGIKTHFSNMRKDSGGEAVNRIIRFMGYEDYLDRNNINTTKLDILKSIAYREPSAIAFDARLTQLSRILREKEYAPDEKLILSTIHSSKGLEYDDVYMMDVIDGIFPESVPHNVAHMKSDEQREFEEERRLFYVGITRAKNRLNIFTMENESIFCKELFDDGSKNDDAPVKPKKRQKSKQTDSPHIPKTKKPVYSEDDYRRFCDALGEGVIVCHRKFRDGVVVGMDSDMIEIDFENHGRKKLALRTLFENGLLALR